MFIRAAMTISRKFLATRIFLTNLVESIHTGGQIEQWYKIRAPVVLRGTSKLNKKQLTCVGVCKQDITMLKTLLQRNSTLVNICV